MPSNMRQSTRTLSGPLQSSRTVYVSEIMHKEQKHKPPRRHQLRLGACSVGSQRTCTFAGPLLVNKLSTQLDLQAQSHCCRPWSGAAGPTWCGETGLSTHVLMIPEARQNTLKRTFSMLCVQIGRRRADVLWAHLDIGDNSRQAFSSLFRRRRSVAAQYWQEPVLNILQVRQAVAVGDASGYVSHEWISRSWLAVLPGVQESMPRRHVSRHSTVGCARAGSEVSR